MNRLFTEAALPASNHKTIARVEHAHLRTARRGQPHWFFAPLHYEANYSYPLLVWLHNSGGDERQLQRIMPLVSVRNYVGVGVRGPSEASGHTYARTDFSQRRFPSQGFDWPEEAADIDAAEQCVLEAIDAVCGKFNVHRQRIFLAGYESGGSMAFRLALRNPQRFAGGLSIGGAFPNGQMPLAKLAQVRKFPLFMTHCRDSRSYPVSRLCEDLMLFHAAGLSVTMRQYPCGDELTTQMLHDMDVWLMEQVTGVVHNENHQPAPLPDWN